jgi:hypothetical protein
MLFVALVAPFASVTGNTIRRWIKTFLKKAGIYTSIYSVHLTRSVASSLAVIRGLSINTIQDREKYEKSGKTHIMSHPLHRFSTFINIIGKN